MANFNTSKRKVPYGSWIHSDGRHKFYDKDKNFYDNTDEIKLLQKELQALEDNDQQ